MGVSYQHWIEAWDNYNHFLIDLIVNRRIKIKKNKNKIKKICEIGGGANPFISIDFIKANKMEYTIIDISKDELAKAPNVYHKIVADITDELPAGLENTYDLVFSFMLAEHVKDGIKFHANVRKLLKPGGIAFHFFPTLFSLPFMINKFLPESLAQKMLNLIGKGRNKEGNKGKFIAHYKMCYGPSEKQIKVLNSLGYRVQRYVGFFGHSYYQKIPFLNFISNHLTKYLLKHPINWLTSYSYVVLKKE